MRRPSRTHTTDDDKLVKLTMSGVTRLFSLVIPYKWRLLLAGVLTLFSSAITLSMPLITQHTIDQITGSHRLDQLDRMVYVISGLILLSAAFGYSQYMLAAYSGNRIVMDLRKKLFAHLQRLPVVYFDRTRSGDLTSYLSNDVGYLQTTLTDDVVKMPGNVSRSARRTGAGTVHRLGPDAGGGWGFDGHDGGLRSVGLGVAQVDSQGSGCVGRHDGLDERGDGQCPAREGVRARTARGYSSRPEARKGVWSQHAQRGVGRA